MLRKNEVDVGRVRFYLDGAPLGDVNVAAAELGLVAGSVIEAKLMTAEKGKKVCWACGKESRGEGG